jgi:hypothetical protein
VNYARRSASPPPELRQICVTECAPHPRNRLHKPRTEPGHRTPEDLCDRKRAPPAESVTQTYLAGSAASGSGGVVITGVGGGPRIAYFGNGCPEVGRRHRPEKALPGNSGRIDNQQRRNCIDPIPLVE